MGEENVWLQTDGEIAKEGNMAYREKDTKKWSAQWFETTATGEKGNEGKEDFLQSVMLWNMSVRKN